jgi:hypothetical protein
MVWSRRCRLTTDHLADCNDKGLTTGILTRYRAKWISIGEVDRTATN